MQESFLPSGHGLTMDVEHFAVERNSLLGCELGDLCTWGGTGLTAVAGFHHAAAASLLCAQYMFGNLRPPGALALSPHLLVETAIDDDDSADDREGPGQQRRQR